jgi:hypothetical protein
MFDRTEKQIIEILGILNDNKDDFTSLSFIGPP